MSAARKPSPKRKRRPPPAKGPGYEREILCSPEETDRIWDSLFVDGWGQANITPKLKRHLLSCDHYAHHVWDLAAIRVAQDGGFFWFARHIQEHWLMYPKIHDAWIGRRLEKCLNTDARIFFEGSRGTFKTWFNTMDFTIYALGREPWHEVMIAQSTYEKACKTVGGIGNMIVRNAKVITLWPHLAPAKEFGKQGYQLWGKTGLLIEGKFKGQTGGYGRDWSVLPTGIGKSLAGEHPTILICDDLHDFEKDVNSPKRVEKTKGFHTELINSVLSSGCPEIVNGTPVGPNDEYAEMRNGKRGEYEHYFMPVRFRLKRTDPWKYPIPKVEVLANVPKGAKLTGGIYGWDEYEVERRKGSMPHYHFMTQYMVIPTSSSHHKFRDEDWIEYETYGDNTPWMAELYRGPGDTPEEAKSHWHDSMDDLVAALDPAIEKNDTNDYTALPIVQRQANGLCWLVDLVYDRLLPHQVVQALFQLYRDPLPGEHAFWNPRVRGSMEEEDELGATCWQPRAIFSEDYTIEKAIYDGIREEEKRSGIRVYGRIRKLGRVTVGNKRHLILNTLEPMFRHQRWRMPMHLVKYSFADHKKIDIMPKFFKEFSEFGLPGVHDDGMDALRMMRKALKGGPQKKVALETGVSGKIPKKEHPLRRILVPVNAASVRVHPEQNFEVPKYARIPGNRNAPFKIGGVKFRPIRPAGSPRRR